MLSRLDGNRATALLVLTYASVFNLMADLDRSRGGYFQVGR